MVLWRRQQLQQGLWRMPTRPPCLVPPASSISRRWLGVEGWASLPPPPWGSPPRPGAPSTCRRWGGGGGWAVCWCAVLVCWCVCVCWGDGQPGLVGIVGVVVLPHGVLLANEWQLWLCVGLSVHPPTRPHCLPPPPRTPSPCPADTTPHRLPTPHHSPRRWTSCMRATSSPRPNPASSAP